jgi:hypothetical protein
MSEETALATLAEADLAALATMAKEASDVGGQQSLPVLKFNYADESAYPKGCWVVGQKYDSDNGVILDEGHQVKALVVLAVKNGYNLYVETDRSKNCYSAIHNQNETVYGANYGYQCGRTCPHREQGVDPRCKAQKVVYGIAITEGGEMIDCVAYMKGTNYMPFVEYIEKAIKVKNGAKYIEIPTYAFTTLISSEKVKKYYVGKYQRGTVFNMDQIKKFKEKREAVEEYIASANIPVIEKANKARGIKEASAGVEAARVRSDAPVPHVGEAPPPWEGAIEVEAEPVEPSVAAAVSSDDDDIEDIISKAISDLA